MLSYYTVHHEPLSCFTHTKRTIRELSVHDNETCCTQSNNQVNKSETNLLVQRNHILQINFHTYNPVKSKTGTGFLKKIKIFLICYRFAVFGN